MAAAYLSAPLHRWEHKAGCSGKAAFPSRQDAKRSADKHGFKLPPYRCDICDSWHLTRQGQIKITPAGWVPA